MNLEERLQVLRQEHAKCKQQIAAFEAQALRIEGAIAIVGEILAAPPKPLASVPLSEADREQLRAVATNPPMTRLCRGWQASKEFCTLDEGHNGPHVIASVP